MKEATRIVIQESIEKKMEVEESKSVFNIKFDTIDPELNSPSLVNGIWRDDRYKEVWNEIAPFQPMAQPKAPEPKFNYFESSYRVTISMHNVYRR